ncbi:unnamed protein product [Camellia sinensis]
MASSSATNNSNIRLKPRLCNCGRTAAICIVRTNDHGNQGHLFFVCPSKYSNSGHCNYFKFMDEDDEDITSTIRSITRACDAITIEDFNDLRASLHEIENENDEYRRRLERIENENDDYGRRLERIENHLKEMVYVIVIFMILYFMM